MCIIPPHLAPPAVEDNHHPKHKALENASKRLGWMVACVARHSAVVCDDDLLPDPTSEMDSELCSELEIPVISEQNASVMEGLIGRLNAPPSHPEINKPLTRDTGKACTRLNGSDAVGPWCH
ncbi:MAG: hypothetical protein RL015_3167 [Verrucomicrobiota bacterium]